MTTSIPDCHYASQASSRRYVRGVAQATVATAQHSTALPTSMEGAPSAAVPIPGSTSQQATQSQGLELAAAPEPPDSTGGASVGSSTLPWSDWEIRPEEIQVMKRPDGSDWELGSGGFGKVFKALRNGVQPVAVKVLLPRGELQIQLEEVRREIAILRACRDVNILQFQGAYLSPERTLLVSEYMEGGDLLHNIAAGRVTWYRRGRKMALDVAKGLVFLHSKRIIHFDLKSPNILLARDGTAKIGDVGLARIMQLDYVTGVASTLAWAAPEILWGQRCTEKADIWSFGIVLWEIITGEQPERGRLRDVRVPQECPAEVRDLMLACLQTSPRKRPSALELAERLRAVPDLPPPATSAGAGAGALGVGRASRDAAGSVHAGPAAREQPSSGAAGRGARLLRGGGEPAPMITGPRPEGDVREGKLRLQQPSRIVAFGGSSGGLSRYLGTALVPAAAAWPGQVAGCLPVEEERRGLGRVSEAASGSGSSGTPASSDACATALMTAAASTDLPGTAAAGPPILQHSQLASAGFPLAAVPATDVSRAVGFPSTEGSSTGSDPGSAKPQGLTSSTAGTQGGTC